MKKLVFIGLCVLAVGIGGIISELQKPRLLSNRQATQWQSDSLKTSADCFSVKVETHEYTSNINPTQLEDSASSGNLPSTATSQRMHLLQDYGYKQTEVPRKVFLQIEELFLKHDFEKINSILQNYQDLYETDFRNEYLAVKIYDVFREPETSLEEIYNEWVNSFPSLYFPFMARCIYYETLASQSRGTGWAKDTTKEQFREMRKYDLKAMKDASKVLEINPKVLLAYMSLISSSAANGDHESRDRALLIALKNNPETFIVRSLYMMFLEPRWGGSYELMDVFAVESQEYVHINPRLRILLGMSKADMGFISMDNKMITEAIDYFSQALNFGGLSGWLYQRARCYQQVGQFEAALYDVELAIERDPNQGFMRCLKARILTKMGREDEAVSEIVKANRVDPEDEQVKEWVRWASGKVISEALKERKIAPQKAIELLDTASELKPESAQPYIEKSLVLFDLEREADAFETLNEIIITTGGGYDHFSLLHRRLIQDERILELEKYWERFNEEHPDEPIGLIYQGLIRAEKGQRELAYTDFKTAFRKSPTYFNLAIPVDNWFLSRDDLKERILFWDLVVKEIPNYAIAYYFRGDGYIKNGSEEDALNDFERACMKGYQHGCTRYEQLANKNKQFEKTPSEPAPSNLKKYSDYDNIMSAVYAGRHQYALQILGRAKPEERDEHYYAAASLTYLGIPEFQKTAEKILNVGKKNFPASRLLESCAAEHLLRHGKKEDAMTSAEASWQKLRGGDDHEAAHILIKVFAENYRMGGSFDKIQDFYNRLIDIYPEREIFLAESIYYDGIMGNFKKCQGKFQKVLASNHLGDTFAVALVNMGFALYFNGDVETSKIYLDKMWELSDFGAATKDLMLLSFLVNHRVRDVAEYYQKIGSSFIWSDELGILWSGIMERGYTKDKKIDPNIIQTRKEMSMEDRSLLALILAEVGHTSASVMARELLEEKDDNPYYQYIYGLALKNSGNGSYLIYMKSAASKLPNRRILKLANIDFKYF